MDINNKLREMVIEKLKDGTGMMPCPFCGGEPVIMSKEFFDELQDDSDDGEACITIECPKCGLELYDNTLDEHDYYVRAFLVMEKWNRRV